jgi:hypothetical protein
LVTRYVRDELRLFERLVERQAVHAEKG